jgi:hypothetical protein
MIARSLGATRVDEALRVVRALGAHRYVAGRLHLVHAFAYTCVPDDAGGVLPAGGRWARATLSDPQVDEASRDEALWRRAGEDEVVAVLDAFWTPGARSAAARHSLRAALARCALEPGDGTPFDESSEDAMHPLLVDAGWELVTLAALDPERHRGAISAYPDALSFEAARFEEETAMPARIPLCELPAIGPAELLLGVDDDGNLAAPLVAWTDGDETYLDYVMRGVRRAAKLPEIDAE